MTGGQTSVLVAWEASRSDAGVAHVRTSVSRDVPVEFLIDHILRILARRAQEPDAHPGKTVVPSMRPDDWSLHHRMGGRVRSLEELPVDAMYAGDSMELVLVYRPLARWLRRTALNGELAEVVA
jgi:hypothetical protein